LGSRPATNGIYTFEVDTLGLVDLSFSGVQPSALQADPSTVGQRYVSWLWAKDFSLADPGPVRAANHIGGAYVDVEVLETVPIVSSKMWSRKGYIMPHGTVLRLQSMVPAVVGIPIVVRLAVLIPQTPEEDAMVRESFCCSDEVATITA
jgi:hypothetical protein